MSRTKPILELRVIMAVFFITGLLLFFILKPIFSTKEDSNIQITKANDKMIGLKQLPKDYTEITPEKVPEPAPAPEKNPSENQAQKPIIKEKVIIETVEKEPTELEKAVAKGKSSAIGFSNFKPVMPKPKEKSRHSIKIALEKPETEFLLQAGTSLSATTVTGINSDLPGHVVARVNRNMYDSITGQYLLIPQGSKLIGEYSSSVKLNQKRIKVSWHQVKLPNGSSINLEKGMPGTGKQGVSGMTGEVDNHIISNVISIFGIALLNSSASYISNATDGDSFSDNVSKEAANDAAGTGADILNKQVQLGPTIKVPVGKNIKVLITQDIFFEGAYNGKTL